MRVGKPYIAKDYIAKDDVVLTISFPVFDPLEARRLAAKLRADKAEEFELSVSKVKKKRSLNQNELMWKLCQMIAEAIGTSRYEVYRSYIRDYGDWSDVLARPDATDDFIRVWSGKGTGWIAEIVGVQNGYDVVRCYKGSSAYTTDQMKRLIDMMLDECKILGIETDERLASLYA